VTAKKKKQKQKIHHRVIGKIKREHIEQIAALPIVAPEPMTQVSAESNDAAEILNEPEHILVAVPKSAWDKFLAWLS
jgi:hypothetical protein